MQPCDLPEDIAKYVADIEDSPRSQNSPGLSDEDWASYLQERKVLAGGGIDTDVAGLMHTWVLPQTKSDPSWRTSGLECTHWVPLSPHLTPAYPGLPATARVSQPKPDLVYGYSGSSAGKFSPFNEFQLFAQDCLDEYPGQRFAESKIMGLQFPFFAMQLRADAGTLGSLWVSENPCAGESAACLSAAERLNDLLRGINQRMVDNLVCCLAMDSRLVQLYVAWKPNRHAYRMHEIGAYRLTNVEDFRDFRRHVRNILD